MTEGTDYDPASMKKLGKSHELSNENAVNDEAFSYLWQIHADMKRNGGESAGHDFQLALYQADFQDLRHAINSGVFQDRAGDERYAEFTVPVCETFALKRNEKIGNEIAAMKEAKGETGDFTQNDLTEWVRAYNRDRGSQTDPIICVLDDVGASANLGVTLKDVVTVCDPDNYAQNPIVLSAKEDYNEVRDKYNANEPKRTSIGARVGRFLGTRGNTYSEHDRKVTEEQNPRRKLERVVRELTPKQ